MEATAITGALSRPESYPHRPRRVEVRETHASWVFIAGDRVYKLKKPIVLDFLDYGTPEQRKKMCLAEVRLNRRLAPDIYLGVRGVALAGDGIELTDADDPRAGDYVVEMRRYDEDGTLASRLERGTLTMAQVEVVAHLLARFHAGATRVSVASPAQAAERRFDRNLQELLSILETQGEIDRVLALERFAHAYVASHAPTFYRRAADGRTREVHGDLRAEHVVLNGGVQVVDCVEFDLDLRQLDVADDLAFLVYDLTLKGGDRFAAALVDSYRGAGGDAGSDSLIAFYATHRALVRAKVALTRGAQQPEGATARGPHFTRARDRILLAERFAWRARLPLTIIVCGVPASGKTHLARALSEASGLPHLSSDVTRKRLAGVAAGRRAPAQVYGQQWNTRTYTELAHHAAAAASEHGGAIVDATFRHRDDRRVFAEQFAAATPVVFIECRVPESVLAHRGSARSPHSAGASDADASVVARERLSWEPLDEVPADSHAALRTDRTLPDIVDDVGAFLDHRLRTLTVGGP